MFKYPPPIVSHPSLHLLSGFALVLLEPSKSRTNTVCRRSHPKRNEKGGSKQNPAWECGASNVPLLDAQGAAEGSCFGGTTNSKADKSQHLLDPGLDSLPSGSWAPRAFYLCTPLGFDSSSAETFLLQHVQLAGASCHLSSASHSAVSRAPLLMQLDGRPHTIVPPRWVTRSYPEWEFARCS